MKKTFLLCVLLFMTSIVFAEGETEQIQTRLTPTNKLFCPPSSPKALNYFQRAYKFQEAQQQAKAIEYYMLALEEAPRFCDAMDNVGLLYRQQGNIAVAISWYEKSLGIFPRNPLAYQNLAVAYRVLKKYDKAEEYFKTLKEIDAQNPEAYYGLGSLYYVDLKEYSKALPELKKAEEIYAKQKSSLIIDTQYLLAFVTYELKDFVGAMAYFEKIYSQKDNDPLVNAYYGLSCLFSRENKNLSLAKKLIKKAQRQGVEFPDYVWLELEGAK